MKSLFLFFFIKVVILVLGSRDYKKSAADICHSCWKPGSNDASFSWWHMVTSSLTFLRSEFRRQGSTRNFFLPRNVDDLLHSFRSTWHFRHTERTDFRRIGFILVISCHSQNSLVICLSFGNMISITVGLKTSKTHRWWSCCGSAAFHVHVHSYFSLGSCTVFIMARQMTHCFALSS